MSFPTTDWNLLSQGADDGGTRSRKALESLCGRYWGPIHAFILSRRIPDPEAQDLTQDFMMHLLSSSLFVRGDRLRGRFRSFLLGALVRFLADADDRRTALKRGGLLPHLSLESVESTELEAASCPHESAWIFDREWALAILENALGRLQDGYSGPGRAQLFKVLRQFLPGTAAMPSYSTAALQLGLSTAALKTEVHRLRRRFRQIVRDEVAQTISAPHEIEAELAHLRGILSDVHGEWTQDSGDAGENRLLSIHRRRTLASEIHPSNLL